MEKAELRAVFENEYPGKEKIVEKLIKPIFAKAKDTTKTEERELSEADKKQIKSFRIIAQVRGGFPITFADVELQDSVALKRSRVNIQNCVRKVLENDTNAIIFFHFSDNAKEWRVSYCHRATSNKESTDAKRYTYLCGTEHACRTIAERFDTLKGLSTIKDEDMLNAFGVEPLSKEFFDQYREHYADLVEYISGKRFVKKGGKFVEEKTKNANGAFKNVFDGDDKLVRDYVKKMMGRLVFLHFLQKKGWLGVVQNEPWGNGDKNFIYNLFKNAGEEVKKDFLEQALEPLFFKTLNTDRGIESLAPKAICDIYGRKIRIPYLNGGLFEEDELDKKKVKFKEEHFETLLEFFNQYNFTIDETDPDDQEIGVDPEMLGKIFENLLEDNKDKGAFYTPKEIVQYMCRESLIAYLNEKTKLDARAFVINHEIAFTDAQKADLLNALLDVKVCDPAVGSGAFPMGMLNELLACTQLLTGNSKTRSELKKHIVKNNIYGVDIEKGAVDIARLRFWLAIIVDEEEPIPLPNLDYKIMQGNSLLESFEGIDLSNLCSAQEDSLFDDSNEIKTLLQYLENYFDRHEEKNAIREAIKASVMELLKKRGISGKQYDALEKLDLHENNQFFLWHTWFNDVFNRPNNCNGFDIVIGNPPYVFARDAHFSDSFKKAVEKKYFSQLVSNKKTKANQAGKINLFVLFIMQGLFIMKEKGILSFIVPNNILRTTTYDLIRKYLLDNTSVNQIVDLGSGIFEKVTASTITIMLSKIVNSKNMVSAITEVKDLLKSKYKVNKISQKQFDENTSYAFNIFIDEKRSLLTRKIEKGCKNFGEYCLDIIEGIVAKKSLIFESDGQNRFPMLEGKCIKKYAITGINKYIEWNTREIHRTRPDYLWNEDEKLVTQRISGGSHPIVVAYDTSKYKSFASTNNIVLNEKYKGLYKYFLALLNSNVLNWYYANNFSNNSTLTVNISKTYLEQLPIPTATPAQQQEIITLVEKILAAKKADASADTSQLEHKIDELVYKLYGLTPEEIAIIEK